MMIEFAKMQGAGNDFIIFNALTNELPEYSQLAKKVCDRRFGIGADGMIVVESSTKADIKMVFYNQDGSRAPMCGNGIRCFAKYVFDNNIVKKKVFNVETLSGIMTPEVFLENEEVENVSVNLGKPIFAPAKIPVNFTGEKFIDEAIEIDKKIYNLSSLFIGTIHTILYVKDFDQIDIEKVGSQIENNQLFPQKTNVNFVKVIDKSKIEVITWERGVGITLACGTGAAASAIISSILYNVDKTVNVHLKGGNLIISQTDEQIQMIGPAKLICTGRYNYMNSHC